MGANTPPLLLSRSQVADTRDLAMAPSKRSSKESNPTKRLFKSSCFVCGARLPPRRCQHLLPQTGPGPSLALAQGFDRRQGPISCFSTSSLCPKQTPLPALLPHPFILTSRQQEALDCGQGVCHPSNPQPPRARTRLPAPTPLPRNPGLNPSRRSSSLRCTRS